MIYEVLETYVHLLADIFVEHNSANSFALSFFKIEFSSIDSAKRSFAFYSLHVSYTFEIISLYAVLKNVKNLKGKYFLKLNHPIPLFEEFEWNEP